MISWKSAYFSVLLVFGPWTRCNARFINIPQQANDPLQDRNVLEALSEAYGANINPPQTQQHVHNNNPFRGGGGGAPLHVHARSKDQQKLLEAIGEAYGVDVSSAPRYKTGGGGNAAKEMDSNLLKAIGETYGVDVSVPQRGAPSVGRIPAPDRGRAQSPEEMKILEAISEAYGVDISDAKDQPPHVAREEVKMLEAISDAYGVEVVMGSADVPQLADPPKTLRGGVHPNPTERYMRPLGNLNRPSDKSMPIFEMSDELGHTGNSVHDDIHLALASPIPSMSIPSPEGAHHVPSIDEIDQWQREYDAKQRDFFNKYKLEQKGSNSITGRFTNIDMDYYSDSSFTNNKFRPNKEFFSVDHNITKNDIGKLDYKLVKSDQDYLDYDTLRLTPHGRHLLLVTLLENRYLPLWEPRFKGKLSYFLPKSLRPPGQPKNPPPGAVLLKDIISHGRIVNGEEMLTRFRRKMPSVFKLEEDISRFNLTHAEAVGSLLEIILGQETFDSTLSILAFIHNYVHPGIFSDTVLTVIDVRDDVGFILPSMQTVNPYDYFQILRFKNLTKYEEKYGLDNHKRFKRQTFTGFEADWDNANGNSFQFRGNIGANNMNRGGGNLLPGRGQVWSISWNEGIFRTLPTTDPESLLWYFREDPMVSAHHLHWHLKMSNRQVPVWHPSNGLNFDRRGEMFYFMHKQMLCRYNADRLGLGLELTTPFLPNEWSQPVYPGYDSKLSDPNGIIYPPRPPGARLPDISGMVMAYNMVRRGIREGTLMMVSGPQRLGYAQGIDYGISALGDALEAFIQSPILGNLHNDGHQQVGLMHVASMGNEGNTGLGVMGQPNGAVRDPLFFRWHKLIDDIHQEYKNGLPAYGDQELDFAGVEITAAHVQSERGAGSNNLYTYMDSSTVRLQSIDLQATDGSSVNIAYDRLNHIPFTYHVNIRSATETQGILRFFLIPAGIRLPSHTDITQVAIEMDRFLIFMNPGDNYFSRHSSSSPFVSKSSMPLVELQERLLLGQITEEQFNWSGCGWPQTLTLPRGREGGMGFRLYTMVSQVLPDDSALTANWERMQYTSWSWCGVRRNEGDVPDSRPMGFPLDRAPPNGNWQSLMFKNGQRRRNHISVDITIRHDPAGTSNRGRTRNNQVRG